MSLKGANFDKAAYDAYVQLSSLERTREKVVTLAAVLQAQGLEPLAPENDLEDAGAALPLAAVEQ